MMKQNGKSGENRSLIEAEIVRLLYSHAAIANFIVIFAAVILVLIQRAVIPLQSLLLWLGFIVFFSLFKLVLSYLFHHRAENNENYETWKNWYIFATFCSSIGWGVTALFFFPPDSITHQVFLAFVLAGVAAGGMATLSMITWAYLSHVLLALFPIIIRFFSLTDTIHVSMGCLAIFYLLLVLRAGQSMHETLISSLQLGFQNSDLLAFLSKTSEETKQLNKDLKKEIVERQRSEETLRESEEKFRMLIETIPQAIVILLNRRPVFVNSIALDMFGYQTLDDIKRVEIEMLIGEAERQRLGNLLEMGTLGEGEIPDHYFTTLKRAGGIEFPAEIFARGVHYKGEPAVQLVIMDTSERQKMEAELFKAAKLESIGVFAGGIAHDYNNLLAGILGSISLAKVGMSTNDENYQWLDEAENAAYRARSLTQQLLSFSRRGEPVKKTISIVKPIKEASLFVLGGSNVKCEFSIPEDLWPVEVDEGQFAQVINNLVINADQAMPEGGIVKISAENQDIEAEPGLPALEGKFVRISIQDQGRGIPEQYQAKIFDPYFSTKEKGTGLGLSICYSIVKNHGGRITIGKSSSQGTTFFIFLPAIPGAKIFPKKEKEKHDRPLSVTGGRILIVDDESMIRIVLGGMLKHLGFEPVYAGDGKEAIKIYKKANDVGHLFEVVIADLTIPGGMGGEEIIGEILKINPQAKVIVFSGYLDDPIMADYQNYGFSGAMIKPFGIDDIKKVLSEVLG